MTVHSPDPDLYDVAYLAGGRDRVVDTALVALVESGRIRVHAPGELAVAEPARRHPVEAAVMDAVGTQGHRSIDTVRWRMTDDERLADLGRSLADRGLLKRRHALGRRGSKPVEWTATAAGHEALRRLAEQPPATPALDGGSAMQVALHGRDTMPDAALRASIFEHPLPELEPDPRGERSLRRRHEAMDRDPSAAALSRTAFGFGGGDAGGGDGGGGG